MAKYRKILVAIDGSLSSMHALKESFKLAECEKCWMTAVSVIPPYLGDLDTTSVGNVIASMRKPCEEALAEAKKLAEEARVPTRTVCEEGEIHERIVDLADAENFDLIVMGRKGENRIERALVGSATARVIGYSQKDVLVIPKDTKVGWNRILVATDGSKFSQAAVEKAIDFALSYGSELIIISVVDVPAEFYGEAPEAWDRLVEKAHTYLKQAKKTAESRGITCSTMVKESQTWQAIVEAADKERIDTIVIGSHGKTGLKRLLMGSVAEKVIGHAPCPVLVVKDH